jgi:hypothetical protein
MFSVGGCPGSIGELYVSSFLKEKGRSCQVDGEPPRFLHQLSDPWAPEEQARMPSAILQLGSNQASCGANKVLPIVMIERDTTEKKTFQCI